MATGVDTTWQLQLLSHGNYNAMHMATGLASTWQLPTFCTYISYHAPFLFTLHLFCFPGILTHFLILAGTLEEISPSLDEVYRRIEEAALQRRSSRGQGQSSSNVPADTVSEDTIRSATLGSSR